MKPGGIRGSLPAAIVVAVLILLAHASGIADGERYYFRDLSQNHGPIFEAARVLRGSGDGLSWNPWSAGGKPLLANPNTLLLAPAGLIAVYAPGGLTASILFGLLLGPVFLVLLLRDTGRSAWGSAAGGLAYGLSGFALSLGTLPNVLAASSWIPAALLLIRKARERPVWTLPAVLACALVLIPCEPVSALVLAVFAFLPLGVGSLRPVRTAGLLALGGGAAACVVLPAGAWILSSARGGGLPPSEIAKWSLGLPRLPEIFAPGFLGDPSRLASWWSGGVFETGFPLLPSLHVGVPALLLGAWGAWTLWRSSRSAPSGGRGKGWAELCLPLTGLGFLVLASGGLTSILMRSVPGLDLFRYPEKLMMGAILSLAFLVALGVDRLLHGETEPRLDRVPRSSNGGFSEPARRFLVMSAAAAAVVLLVASALASPSLVGGWFRLPESAVAFRTHAAGGVRTALVLGAVQACLLLLALLLARRVAARGFGAAVLGALGSSLAIGALVPGPALGSWRVRANPSAPAALLEQGPFFEDRLAKLTREGGRLFRYERPSGFAVRNRTGTMADLFAWERRSMERSSAAAFGVELVYDRSTDRLDPAGEEAARAKLDGRATDVQKRFWDLASVRLVLSYAPLAGPGLTMVDRIADESRTPLFLYASEGAFPRAWMASRARTVPSQEAAIAWIASAREPLSRDEVLIVDAGMKKSSDVVPPGGLERSNDVLERVRWAMAGAPSRPSALPYDLRVKVLERRPSRLRMRIAPSSEPGDGQGRDAVGSGPGGEWLVLGENDVPGWRATVNGEAVDIRQAYGMFMAIPVVGEGPHEVELRFVPPGLFAGIGVSILSLGLAGMVAVRGRRRVEDRDVASPAPNVVEAGERLARERRLENVGTSVRGA